VIDLVALDADDTLWHNEPLFTSVRDQFCSMLGRYQPEGIPNEWLDAVELRNLQHFGYGVKGFVLSMIETAIEMTGGRVESSDIRAIIEWGREMLGSPVELLDGVCEVVENLAKRFPLILLTKGDLLHQESKLARSGLGHHFKGIEIVSEKDAPMYRRVMTQYGVPPDRFVMVGNSLRSDILPVIEAGGHAVYVPYQETWVRERVDPEQLASVQFQQIPNITALPDLLSRM
jgi:putative hydrolase of the HAD superfamily